MYRKRLSYLSLAKILLFLIITNSLFAQENTESILNDLDDYYAKAITEWEVPGMAVGIVKEGEVIFTKGYGIRHIDDGGDVDEKTIFAIASLTKAFTSAAIAILVDEGKLEWDDKVREHIPYFEMYNPYVTENMTIRDLLCHRSGLATFSGDLLWFETVYDREDIIKRIKYLKPVYGFRSNYGYSNLMFLVAGEVIEKISGQSWDSFIKEKFFKPLGMKNSYTSINDFRGNKNVASPHTIDAETFETVAVPYLNWDNIAPAGGINSCVKDYVNWIKLQLAKGIFDKDTIFSPKSSWEMWSANTPLDVSQRSSELWPSTHFKAYGLGWGLSDYWGRKIVTHGGGTDGMTCYTALVPEEELGIVILTNKYSSLYYALTYQTLDAFLAPEDIDNDWSKTLLNMVRSRRESEKEKREKAKQEIAKETQPSLPLNNYAGTYGGELYGDAEIRYYNDELYITMIPAPKLTSKLTHLQYNTFSIKFDQFPGLPEGTVNFIIDKKGNVEELRIDVPNPDFDFTELKFFKRYNDTKM